MYGAREFDTVASWYGPGFQGRRTASGERFDENAMTAASKTLPFGTHVLVRNPKNDRECMVVINDRGPYVPGRGIDLSRAAARKLHIGGVAPVICYVGGSSYLETAHKLKTHKHMNTGDESAPYAVPSPSPPESADIANLELQNQSARAIPNTVAGHAQASVASVPPDNRLNSAVPSAAEHMQALNDNAPTVQPNVQRTEQIPNSLNSSPISAAPLRTNDQIAHLSSYSNNLVDNTVHPVTVKVQPKASDTPTIIRTKDTSTEISPTSINDPYKLAELRRPGQLIAAATRLPDAYPTANPLAGTPVGRIIQSPAKQIGQRSMPTNRPIIVTQSVIQSAPTSTVTRLGSTRIHSRATGRYYVVAQRGHHRYMRRSNWGGRGKDHIDYMLDRLTTKVTHVCRSVLASL
jgi:rare lipoprotein A